MNANDNRASETEAYALISVPAVMTFCFELSDTGNFGALPKRQRISTEPVAGK